jgi:hypothetical protein
MQAFEPTTTPARRVGWRLVNLDSGQVAVRVGEEAGRKLQLVPPKPVREAVHPQRVQARVHAHRLERRTRRGVVRHDRAHVLARAIERPRERLQPA